MSTDATRTAPPEADLTRTQGEPPTRTGELPKDESTVVPHTPTAAGAVDAPPGFVIEREIGVGGMGVVYLARQMGLNRPVALKLVKDARVDAKALIRFLAEAEAVAAVRHPNVVEVYQYGDHHGRPYMALEYCPGGDLTTLTKAEQTRDANWFRKVADLMAKVADGVEAAHALGIVHRDLKPHNVFLTADGTPKVADFGLAKRGVGSDLTNTDAVMGTPAYMSPEQAGGGTKFVGPEADVWALGVMLYELACGERPIDTSGPLLDAVARVAHGEVSLLRTKAPSVPPDLALIAHKCLSADPRDRYPTAGGLATDLRNWLDGKPISARSAGVIEQAVKWAKRKPTLAGLYAAGLFGVVLAGVAVGLTVLWREADAAHVQADSARKQANTARAGEEDARRGAEKDRDDLRVAREKLAAVEYGRTIQVAYQECLNGNVGGAMTLLESTRPDLRGWEWRYVHKLCNGQSLTLTGHTGMVWCVVWSPDGTKVLTGGQDNTARIWDARSGRELLVLKGHTDVIHSATFSPDGTKVLTSTVHFPSFATSNRPDGTARIWDATSGKQLAVLKGHTSQHIPATFSPDGTRVLTAHVGGGARIWDATTGEPTRTIRFGPEGKDPVPPKSFYANDNVKVARWTPDGKRVALLRLRVVGLYDVESGELIREFSAERDQQFTGRIFLDAAVSPDGTKLATGLSEDAATELIVRDVASGKSLARLPGRLGSTIDAWHINPFNQDGTKLVGSLSDGMARVWDMTTGKELFTLMGKGKKSREASFSSDGSRIVTTWWDNYVVTVWDAATGEELAALSSHTKGIFSATLSPDGSRVATGSGDGTARIWVLPARPKPSQPRAADVTDWAPDGQRYLAQAEGMSVLTNVRTQQTVSLEGSGSVRGQYFSSDGQIVIGENGLQDEPGDDKPAEQQQVTAVWDAISGKKLCTVPGHCVTSSSNRDRTRLLTAFDDGTARIWDMSGQEVAVLHGHTSKIAKVWWNSDGSQVLTLGQMQTGEMQGLQVPNLRPVPTEPLRVWDTLSGREITTIKMPLYPVVNQEIEWVPLPRSQSLRCNCRCFGFSRSVTHLFREWLSV